MAERRGDMALNNPVESFSEKVENVRCRLRAEDQYDTVIELILPSAAQQIPVGCANGDVPECILQIELGEEAALTKAPNLGYSGIEGFVNDARFGVRYAVIN